MFTKQVEAILSAVALTTKNEWRIAHCRLQIEMDYQLAKEFSTGVADVLYRPSPRPWKSPSAEFRPCLDLTYVQFNLKELGIGKQQMEFRALPELPIPGAVIPGVELRYVHAIRTKDGDGHTLVLGICLQFAREQSKVLAKLLLEQLASTVFLTFKDQQGALALDHAADSAASINEKARAQRGK